MGSVLTKTGSVITTGLTASLNEAVNVIFQEGKNKEGNQVMFTNPVLASISGLYEHLTFLENTKVGNAGLSTLLRSFVIHAQDFVGQPNQLDVSHNYRTWGTFTNEKYYGRSLPEIESQWTLSGEKFRSLLKTVKAGVKEGERKYWHDLSTEQDVINMWTHRFKRLQVLENDSLHVKAEKQKLLDQLPHSVVIGEYLFTRPEDKQVEDRTTNYFLGCFAQWFVEQAFKTGTDPKAKVGLESLTDKEFKKQWGENKIDLSNLYGGSESITLALRTHSEGLMKTQIKVFESVDDNGVKKKWNCEFPPRCTFKKPENCGPDEVSMELVEMFFPSPAFDKVVADCKEDPTLPTGLLALGHPRFNLHFGMTFVQTLWLREHNQVARMLGKVHHGDPLWDDERIFQTTRLILISELSKVVVEDYIQHIMGYSFDLKYTPESLFNTKFQYRERCHFEFNFVYRWHSMVPDSIEVTKEGDKEKNMKTFKEVQFDQNILTDLGMVNIYKNLTAQPITKLGLNNTPDFLKFLDTTTLAHGRCMKAQSYCEYKAAFEGKKITSFEQITSDKALQDRLEKVYGHVEKVDYYIGLLAEDHLPKGPTGSLMQTQLGIYALAAIFSNPLCSEEMWNENTFTKEGFERIKTTRLAGLINRNLQELGGTNSKPAKAIPTDPKFDCFRPTNVKFATSTHLDEDMIKMRTNAIAYEKTKWIVDPEQQHRPYHRNDKVVDASAVVDTLLLDHTSVLSKNQLREVFNTIKASTTLDSFLSTFKTQFDIIMSQLLSSNKHFTDQEAKKFIKGVDQMKIVHESKGNLIDSHFGSASVFFSNYQADHLMNFAWNKDEVFGESILNGLDPTQLKRFTKDLFTKGFENFKGNASINKFFAKWGKFESEIEAGNVYYLDHFEMMDLIKSNSLNIGRPRSLFYYDNKKQKLYPFAIQLNNRVVSSINVTVVKAQQLKNVHWIVGSCDPWVKVQCNGISKETKVAKPTENTDSGKKRYDASWEETFEFNAEDNDTISFSVYDDDVLLQRHLGNFDIHVNELKDGSETFERELQVGGTITVIVKKLSGKYLYEDGVYTPAHPNWTIAKLYAGNAFVIHHEMISHNLKCHSLMENVSIVLHRTLFHEHPVFALLEPHLYYTDVINLLARKTLMKDDGTGLVSVLFSCGLDGYAISDWAWSKFKFEDYVFKDNIASRGVSGMPTNYFAKDGNAMWEVIETYVTGILAQYYKTELDFKGDVELMDFLTSLRESEAKFGTYDSNIGLPGMAEVTDVKGLIRLITALIFNSTSMHTSLHWSQLDQLSFAPLLPTILNRAPPAFEDTSFGIPKEGFKLYPQQEKILMQYLPTMGQAIMINSTFHPVTKKTDLPLLEKDMQNDLGKYNLFTDGPCFEIFQKFQEGVARVKQSILDQAKKDKSGRGKYVYMSSQSRSINF